MERNAVKATQIRCPYCRTIQNKLLPEKMGYKNVHGVNFYDEESENMSKLLIPSNFAQGKCCYKYGYPGCHNTYVKKLHLDNNTYCSAHYNLVFSKLYKEKKLKEKQEKEQKKATALLQKIKAQEEKQKIKDEKQKAKEEKQKEKDEEKLKKAAEKMQKKTQKTHNENVIVSSSSPQSGCIQILKTGNNKGTQCGCKISQDGLCGRHYKLLHPVSPDEQI
jgi:flagellar biosynthesis GTPase FlhF